MEQQTIQTIEFQKQFTKSGYIRIFVDNEWIFEHKYICEQMIGRKLNKGECVHHLNSIRTDNRISNLVIFPSQKEHVKFENKIRQFGWTNNRLREIANRWVKYEVKE